jgi:hypothetical protein
MTTACNDEGPNSYDKNNKIPRKHELPSLSRIAVRCLILDIDRFEAGLGDAKGHRFAVIASPDRERATGADLLQQAGAD